MPSATFSMRLDADMKRRLEEQAARSDRSSAWSHNRQSKNISDAMLH